VGAGLYPPIEPDRHGFLDVGDGQQVYWERCGNPDGRPALVLHGGPGSGCSANSRRYFDPRRTCIVLFDQRGCGRSRPHAADRTTSLAANTTHHLLADMERLRQHLAIPGWLLFGSSWGSTLALVYAQRHPDRVSGIVLRAVATTSAREIEWITRGVGLLLPEAWERFRDGVPPCDRQRNLAQAYSRLLESPDAATRETAARDWCAWEQAVLTLHQGHPPDPRFEDPRFRYAFARLVTHYWSHGAWLAENEVLGNAPRLAGIPGIMVHGRLDLGSPWRRPGR